MKRLKIALALIFMIMLPAGCGTVNKTYQAKLPEDVRPIFVGTWAGEHVDHDGKLLRAWIQVRSEDGTYTITFVHHTEDGIYSSEQKGKWWVEGDRFHEIAPNEMEEPYAYQFEILSEDEIRFKSMVNDYEFIDRRVQDFRGVSFI